jgi:hypothetical protein
MKVFQRCPSTLIELPPTNNVKRTPEPKFQIYLEIKVQLCGIMLIEWHTATHEQLSQPELSADFTFASVGRSSPREEPIASQGYYLKCNARHFFSQMLWLCSRGSDIPRLLLSLIRVHRNSPVSLWIDDLMATCLTIRLNVSVVVACWNIHVLHGQVVLDEHTFRCFSPSTLFWRLCNLLFVQVLRGIY